MSERTIGYEKESFGHQECHRQQQSDPQGMGSGTACPCRVRAINKTELDSERLQGPLLDVNVTLPRPLLYTHPCMGAWKLPYSEEDMP
jgi:hypothetical protein